MHQQTCGKYARCAFSRTLAHGGLPSPRITGYKAQKIMKRLTTNERRELVDAAMGRRRFDLLMKNVKLVNVFSGEIYPAEIGLSNGYIAHVEKIQKGNSLEAGADKIYDGMGRYAVPGFIDSHVHIESSMVTPYNFAKIVIPKGTTTVVTDPHEIANVMGIEGVEYMIEAGRDVPMYQYALSPSCVPSVPGLEEAGAVFGKEEIERIIGMERVLGVAEVMDYYGVINNSKRMMEILDLALEKDCFVQGHFFSNSDRELSAYLCAGPNTNHEFITGTDARRAIRAGMVVDARESSFAKNVKSIVEGIKELHSPKNLTICTDDRDPKEIITKGHINDCLRIAIKSGLNRIDAIRAATINSASVYGLKRLGAIAPGYIANINLVDDLEGIHVESVFFEGNLVAENDELLVEIEPKAFPLEKINSIYLDDFSVDRLRIKAAVEEGRVKVRVIKYQDLETLVTETAFEKVAVRNGYVTLEDRKDLNFIAVFNRHKVSGNCAVGIVGNFCLSHGAIAGTVSHDCHNLCVVYTNLKDAVRAIEEVRRIGGGIVFSSGNILKTIALPIAGLMSRHEAEKLIPDVDSMNEVLREAGIEFRNPVMRLATAALPVIPSIKITDLGIVDVVNQRLVDLFVQ